MPITDFNRDNTLPFTWRVLQLYLNPIVQKACMHCWLSGIVYKRHKIDPDDLDSLRNLIKGNQNYAGGFIAIMRRRQYWFHKIEYLYAIADALGMDEVERAKLVTLSWRNRAWCNETGNNDRARALCKDLPPYEYEQTSLN